MTQKFPFEQFLKLGDEGENFPFNQPKDNKTTQPKAERSVQTSQPTSSQGLPTEQLQLLGQEILGHLRSFISPTQFATFFENTFHASDMTDDAITFTVTTSFIKRMIEGQYLPTLKQVLHETLGRNYEIEIKTLGQVPTASLSSNKENVLKQVRENNSAKSNTFILNDLTPTKADIIRAVDSKVIENSEEKSRGSADPKKTFASFVTGPSNNLAHAAALAVARDPGKIYPNLYIHGNSGLGKTHLIHAIANYIQTHKPNLRVTLISFNNFMAEYVESFKEKKNFEFRKRYIEQTDVLVIDDIHELSNKTGTQEQFFHIFNELSSTGKQIIVTSDKTPKEIVGIEERIRTRLNSALIVDVTQPDLETRLAILKAKSQENDTYFGDDVINLIAKCVKSSIRELENCLVRLGAYSSLMKIDIDLEMAKDLLKLEEAIEHQRQITMESITKRVASYYSIQYGDIRAKTKTKDIALARQVAMYLIHQHLKKTLIEIAQYFGKKDHTTVMHGINVIKGRMKLEAQLAQQILDIENSL